MSSIWADWEIFYVRAEVYSHLSQRNNIDRPSAASRIRFLHSCVLKYRSYSSIQQKFYKELRQVDRKRKR